MALTLDGLVYSGTFPDAAGNIFPINYTTYTPFEMYPSSNMTSVLGPIYTPQIYAKDLDTLDIASSGRISFVVSETRVLDLYRDDTTDTTHFLAASNESLLFEVENGNAQMLLDATTCNVEIFAQNQIIFTACNGVTFTAVDDVAYTTDANLMFRSKSNISLVACNDINIVAHKDIYMSAKDGEVIFWLDPPNANIYFTASNSIYFDSIHGEIKLLACESNVEICMSNDSLYMYAQSNIEMTACNDILMNIEDKNVFHAYTNSNDNSKLIDIESDYFSFGKRNVDGSVVKFTFHINDFNELTLTKQEIDNLANVTESHMVAKYSTQRRL